MNAGWNFTGKTELVNVGMSIIRFQRSHLAENQTPSLVWGSHHRWPIRRNPPPPPPTPFHVLYYINNTFVPGVAGGFWRWRPRLSTLGCSAGGSEAAKLLLSPPATHGRRGSLKMKQLCAQGRGHANTSCIIDFTCLPVPTWPWISLSDIGFTFSCILRWQRVSIASTAAAQAWRDFKSITLEKYLASTRRSKH